MTELPATFGDGAYFKNLVLTEAGDAPNYTTLLMPTSFRDIAPYVRLHYSDGQYRPVLIYVDANHGELAQPIRAPYNWATLGGYLTIPRFDKWWIQLVDAQPALNNFIVSRLGPDYDADGMVDRWYNGPEG